MALATTVLHQNTAAEHPERNPAVVRGVKSKDAPNMIGKAD